MSSSSDNQTYPPHDNGPQPEPTPAFAPDLSAEDVADIVFWTEQHGRPVSKTEVDEIKANLLALVDFLVEHERNKGKISRA